MKYFILNNDLVENNQEIAGTLHRASHYGDGVFETMQFRDGKILFADDHFQRLKEGMILLHLRMPSHFSLSNITEQVHLLVQKNHGGMNARIRLQANRSKGGYYFPSLNDAEILIESEALNTSDFPFYEKGILMTTCPTVRVNRMPVSNYKTCSALPYVLAALHAQNQNCDDCFIMNDAGNISDSVRANVFVVWKDEIITPPLSDGCISGVMRKNLLKFWNNTGTPVTEKSISEKTIYEADEIFLTNVISGIRWIERYKEKTFLKNQVARAASGIISELIR